MRDDNFSSADCCCQNGTCWKRLDKNVLDACSVLCNDLSIMRFAQAMFPLRIFTSAALDLLDCISKLLDFVMSINFSFFSRVQSLNFSWNLSYC